MPGYLLSCTAGFGSQNADLPFLLRMGLLDAVRCCCCQGARFADNFTFPGTYRITTELKLPWRTGSVLFCSREVDPYHTKLNYNAKNEEQ